MQAQQEFNSICFHRKCISEYNQLFLSTPHSFSSHQAHYELHTRILHRKSFQSRYPLSHRLMNVRLKQLIKEVKENIDDRMCQFEAQLKKRYVKELLKHAKTSLKQLNSKQCANLMKRLRENSLKRKDEEIEVINELYQGIIGGINNLIEHKLRPITSSLDSSINNLFESFYQLIPAHFTQKFEENTVKIEQEDESSSEKIYIAASSRPQESENIQPIEQEKVDQEEQLPLKTNVKKKRNRGKHLEFVEFQRTRTRKNYIQLHNYGKDVEKEEVDTFIVETISQLRQLMKQELIRPCNLVINYILDEEVLTEAINHLSPLRLTLNAEFQQGHFFDKISPSVLNNLLILEQGWSCSRFFEEYMKSLFFPIKNQQSLKKLRIPAVVWKQLSKIENLCISNAADLSELKKSKKPLSQIRSLHIQPCSLSKEAFPLEILRLASQITLLETLVLRNVKLTEDYTELVVHLLQQNSQIQCLVFEEVDSLPNEIVRKFGKLPLNKLIIHLEEEGSLDLSLIAAISSLEYLSLRNIRPSYSSQTPSFKLKHLDLYGCGKDCQDVIKHLCGQAPRALAHLTVGKNQLSDDFGVQLKSFARLTHLNLDQTSLNLRLFLSTLNKSMIQLQSLSLLGFLDIDDNDFEESTNLLMEEELQNMLLKNFPKLTYLNLSSKQFIAKAKRLHSGITLCLKGVKQN